MSIVVLSSTCSDATQVDTAPSQEDIRVDSFTNKIHPYIMYEVDSASLSEIVVSAITVGDSLGIPPEILLAIIRKESTFNRLCIGASGELGLMQVLPSTARSVCRIYGIQYNRDKMFTPEYNILIGALYLKHQWGIYKDLSRTFVAYNAGRGYCQSNGYSRDVFRHLAAISD